MLPYLNVRADISVTTTPCLPTTRVYLTIGYYVFGRHQARIQFHNFETSFYYYHETQWRQLFSLGSIFSSLCWLTEEVEICYRGSSSKG